MTQRRGLSSMLAAAFATVLTLAATGCSPASTSERKAAAGTDGASKAGATEGRRLAYDEQRRFDAIFLEAVRQRQRGNNDAAFELLNAALDLNPDAPEALYEKAQVCAEAQSAQLRTESDSLLRRAIAFAPDNNDYKEMLAAGLSARGEYAEAARLYGEAAATSTDVGQLHTLVQLREAAHDYEGAIATLDRLEALEGKNERYSVEKFRLYSELGDPDHAYAAIEELCAQYPTDLRYRVLLGDLYFTKGYREMAYAVYRDVLTLEPENSYAQISLLAYYNAVGEDSLYHAMVDDVVLNPSTQSEARVEAMRGLVTASLQSKSDTTEVLGLFRRALRMPQDNGEMGRLCVYYMKEIGKSDDDVVPVIEKILEAEPDFDAARLNLLSIYLRRRDMEGVVKVCSEGRLYNPSQVVYYYYEGLGRLMLDDNDGAAEALQAGAEQVTDETDTETASDLFASLGDVLHEKGRADDAFEAYETSLTYNSSNIGALNNYAYFLSLDGRRLDYAASMSRRTLDAEPDNATYLDTYAWILYLQKQYTQARIYIDRAIACLSDDDKGASLYDHAGDIYYHCRERAEAVKFWVKALAASDEAAERAAIRRKIQRRRP